MVGGVASASSQEQRNINTNLLLPLPTNHWPWHVGGVASAAPREQRRWFARPVPCVGKGRGVGSIRRRAVEVGLNQEQKRNVCRAGVVLACAKPEG